MKYLCEEHEANKDAKNNAGETPLVITTKEGNLDMVKYLCEDLKVNKEAAGHDGRTPLHYAIGQGNLDMSMVEYLCEGLEVEVDATDSNGETMLHTVAYRHGCRLLKINSQNYSLLEVLRGASNLRVILGKILISCCRSFFPKKHTKLSFLFEKNFGGSEGPV